jgi:uncharacterized Zn finger protein
MAKRRRALSEGAEAAVEDSWRRLTWDDLEAWAGVRSVQRGRSYQRSGRVQDLARTEDGGLTAWVRGTQRYATLVEPGEQGEGTSELTSRCTCPVGTRCKHAVAVVVAYLDALQHGRDVPVAAGSDRRLRLLAGEEMDEETGGELADEENEEAEEEWSGPAHRSRAARPARPGAAGRRDQVRTYLEGLPPAELVTYVLNLVAQYPEVGRELQTRSALAQGEAGELVRQARREIRRLTAEPAWANHWTGESNLPDYGGLKRLFERLLEMGQADALLELGETLMETGTRQVGSSDDEGETAGEIAACLDVVLRAVPASGRPDADKLLYTIDLLLGDEYDLIQDADVVLERDWPASAWSTVADRLAERLRDLPAPRGEDFFSRYQRDGLSGWMITALRASGREAEVLPLMEAEARVTGSYQRLVDELLAARRVDDARRWALEGIERTQHQWPGIAEHLRQRLGKLAEQRKDWPAVAAMRAEEFFTGPSVHTLKTLEKAAERARCRPAVRAAALHFLETGVRPAPAKAPGTGSRRSGKSQPAKAGPAWPLPEVPPELRHPDRDAWPEREGPHYDVLLQLALKDRQSDDILRWYDLLCEDRGRAGYGGYDTDNLAGQVADAVAATHPDRAAAVYREIVDGYIAQTSPAAYEAALPYLRKLRDLLHRQKRDGEWRQYLAGLRETERRKRRLMEVLDRLERRPIVEG